MPPKAQKKPAAPKKPTKPSAKSKTGNTACSQAASNWQLAIRGKEPLDPQTYATLAKCRSMTRTAKQADDRARMGYNLNDQGAAALKGRLQKRFDQGLITQKSRDERLKTLLQQRKEKQAAVAAKPVTQTVEKLTGTKAVAQRFENAENKFIEHAISHAGLTRPQAVTALNAMTKAKAVKIDPIIGQFSFTHGAFGDKAVIRRAAGIEPAKPADKAADLVKKVRELPKYTLAKSRAKANQKKISDLMSNPQDFLVQRGKYRSENATYANRSATERFRGKNAVADAISDLKERRRERAEGDLTLGQRRAMQKPADKNMTSENKIPESKQIQAMKNKLERMKGQFDSKFEDWSSQTRGHGGTPFIMDNSKGRAQYKRHQKGNESLINLNKAIKEQEEKIQAAEYRHIGRHTQTKKSEKFVEKNPVSPGLQYLEQKGLVKSWPKKPEFHFVQGVDKTALITVEGRVGVARKYNGGTEENFLAAKKLASIANSYNRTQSLVSSVRQKPGYGVARASAAGNRELVGLKMRDKGTVTTQPAFTLKQSSSQGGTGAGRSMGVLFQTEGTALDKAAQAGQKAPLAGQGSLFRGAAIDNKTTRRLEFNEAKRQAYSGTLNLSRESLKRIKIGGMEVTTSERPGIYNVFHSVTGRQMGIIDTTSGKDHRISTESYGYSEKNAQNLKKISEEMRKIKFKSELGSLASRQSTQGPSSYVFGRLSGKKSEEYRISFNPAARKIAQPETQPPKPAFSRQGQLAPGRGTPERNEMALMLRGARNTLKSLKDIGKKRLTESGRKGLITKASKQLSQLRSLARYGTNWANIKSYD